MINKEKLIESLDKLEKYIEKNNYRGFDPADGMASPLRKITFGNLFLDRVFLQLVQRTPINLRPLLGVGPLDSYIGRGYMAWGYLTMLKVTGNEAYKDKAVACLEFLIKNKAPGFKNYSWGKLFDFASRSGLYKAGEPILIWTALIGQAFLEAFELLNDAKYLNVADSLCHLGHEITAKPNRLGLLHRISSSRPSRNDSQFEYGRGGHPGTNS